MSHVLQNLIILLHIRVGKYFNEPPISPNQVPAIQVSHVRVATIIHPSVNSAFCYPNSGNDCSIRVFCLKRADQLNGALYQDTR